MCSVFDSNYGRHLPVARDARILDIGCGSGRMLAFLESRGYTNILGVDIDAGVLLQVPGHLQDRTMQITDLSAFLHEHSEIFDLILAKDVLYYFSRHEVTQRMLEIAQAIRPGGRIVVEVFNGAVLTATYTAAKDVGILAIYTEQSIRTLLEGAGLHVTEVYGQRPGRGGGHYVLCITSLLDSGRICYALSMSWSVELIPTIPRYLRKVCSRWPTKR